MTVLNSTDAAVKNRANLIDLIFLSFKDELRTGKDFLQKMDEKNRLIPK